MGQADFGTGKSLVVLAIVAGCFAILWPKIFYPMMQTAFAITSQKPNSDSDQDYKDSDRPPHIHPGSINPRLRGAMPESIQDKFNMREGRPFPHPQVRQPAKAQPKSGGAMSIMMPVYTIGIMVFFLYTVLKLVFKKPSENDKKPLLKDFHMDPEYRKFVCQQPVKEPPKAAKDEKGTARKRKGEKNNLPTTPENPAPEFHPAPEFDAKDYEIYQLKKKLEETEQAMQRIMKHMGAMSACLSDKLTPDESTPCADSHEDVAPNAKGKKVSKKSKTKNGKTNGENRNHESCKKLQEDLAKVIKMSNVPKLEPNAQTVNLSDKAQHDNESDEEDDDVESQSDGLDNDQPVDNVTCEDASCMGKKNK